MVSAITQLPEHTGLKWAEWQRQTTVEKLFHPISILISPTLFYALHHSVFCHSLGGVRP